MNKTVSVEKHQRGLACYRGFKNKRKTLSIILFSFVAFLSIQTPLSAKPLEFLGIGWSMNADQINKKLTSESYICKVMPITDTRFYTQCRKDDSIITVLPKFISFNCHSFQGCGSHLKAMARAIVDKFKINLEYTLRVTSSDSGYCGDGPDGDRICVIESAEFGKVAKKVKVYLYRGSLGNKPKF